MTFDRDDLLADISNKELTALTTRLVEVGSDARVETTIPEAVQRVEDYTARYVVPDGVLKRLCRALVLWEIYKPLASIPEKRRQAYDDAMRELREIRDGKFASVYPSRDIDPAPAASGKGRWGSEAKFNTR